jgi:nitrite reductase/ring-hydroxylating ferredoxin subunit
MSFNILNYQKVSPYDPGMKHYPVKVEDGGIWVGEG